MDWYGDGSACRRQPGCWSVTIEHYIYINHVLYARHTHYVQCTCTTCALRTHCMYSLCYRPNMCPPPHSYVEPTSHVMDRRWVGPPGGAEVTREEIAASDPADCSGRSFSTCVRYPGPAPWGCLHGLPNQTGGNLSPRDPGRSPRDLHPKHSSASAWLPA